MYRRFATTFVIAVITFLINPSYAQTKAELSKYDKMLLEAAKSGNFAKIRESLAGGTIRRGAHINVQDDNGDTALMITLKNGYFSTANALVSEGADPSIKNAKGTSPILLALKKASDIWAAMRDTPSSGWREDQRNFQKAAEKSQPWNKISLVLLNAAPNKSEVLGNLIIFKKDEFDPLVSRMFQEVWDKSGFSDKQLFEAYLKAISERGGTTQLRSLDQALLQASLLGNEQLVRYILKQRTPKDISDHLLFQSFVIAAHRGNVSVVKEFLESKIDFTLNQLDQAWELTENVVKYNELVSETLAKFKKNGGHIPENDSRGWYIDTHGYFGLEQVQILLADKGAIGPNAIQIGAKWGRSTTVKRALEQLKSEAARYYAIHNQEPPQYGDKYIDPNMLDGSIETAEKFATNSGMSRFNYGTTDHADEYKTILSLLRDTQAQLLYLRSLKRTQVDYERALADGDFKSLVDIRQVWIKQFADGSLDSLPNYRYPPYANYLEYGWTPFQLALHKGSPKEIQGMINVGFDWKAEIKDSLAEFEDSLFDDLFELVKFRNISIDDPSKRSIAKVTEILLNAGVKPPTIAEIFSDHLFTELANGLELHGINVKDKVLYHLQNLKSPDPDNKWDSLGIFRDWEPVRRGALLTWFAEKGWLEHLQIAIEKGAPINSQDKDGNTALMIAAKSGNSEMVEFLISAGADTHRQAIELAIENKRWTVVKLFEERDYQFSEQNMSNLIKNDQIDIITILQSKGHPFTEEQLFDLAMLGQTFFVKNQIAKGFKFSEQNVTKLIQSDQIELITILDSKGHRFTESQLLMLVDRGQTDVVKNQIQRGFRFQDPITTLRFSKQDQSLSGVESEIRKSLFLSKLQNVHSESKKLVDYQDPLNSKIVTPAYEVALQLEINDEKIWEAIGFSLPIFNRLEALQTIRDQLVQKKAPQSVIDSINKNVEVVQKYEESLGKEKTAHLLSLQENATNEKMKTASVNDVQTAWSEYIKNVRAENPSPGNFASLKQAIETALLKANAQQPVKYNKNSSSIYAPICDGKLQCYSGTLLFIETASELWADKELEAKIPIVIFTNGHITPGFAQATAQSKELEIFGIETTARGDALVSFGLASELHQRNNPVRIFLAEDFREIEKLKFGGTDRKILESKIQDALLKASEKLALPLKELEQQIAQIQEQANSEHPQNVNATSAAFGKAIVPDGDLERAEFKTLDIVEGGHPNPIEIIPPGLSEEVLVREERFTLEQRQIASMLIHNLIGATESIASSLSLEEPAEGIIEKLMTIDDKICYPQ